MHGKVLIVDPIATNHIILKVKFSAAYYTVTQALTLAAAIAKSRPDIVITADQLLDGTARNLVSQMHELPMGHDIPIIAIESCQNFDNQLPLLEAGIDVILSQPLDDALLLARMRSLVRSNSSDSDWELGEGTSHALGFAEAQKVFVPSGRAVLVGPNRALPEDWTTQMAGNLPTQTKVAGVDEAINIF